MFDDPLYSELDRVNRKQRQTRSIRAKLKRQYSDVRARAGEYPVTWDRAPGDEGFADYVRPYLAAHLQGVLGQCDDASKLQPYQASVAYLLHPSGPPVQRLLVAHRTGSGKTRIIVSVLSNYYHDPRPKIVVFPSDRTRDQFYETLLRTPNPYSDHLRRAHPDGLELGQAKKALAMTGTLRKKGLPGFLAAPLRAYSYNEIGGKQFREQKWLGSQRNKLDGKIVLMDEAHNLVVPGSKITLESTKANLLGLKKDIQNCTGSVVALLTATPIMTAAREGRELLDIVKGRVEGNDEGFLSSFQGSTNVFPHLREHVRRVPLPVTGPLIEAWLKDTKDPKKQRRREFTASLQEYRDAYRRSLLEDPGRSAPLVHAVCEILAASEGKCLVLTDKDHGFFSLDYLWHQKYAEEHGRMYALLGKNASTSRKDFVHHDMGETIRAFDDPANDDGSQCRALLLNAETFAEGADFKSVRTVVILDLAKSYGNWVQRIGRAVRFCSHKRLPVKDQVVDVHVLVPVLPELAVVRGKDVDLRMMKTIGETLHEALEDQRHSLESSTCSLVAAGYDVGVVSGSGCDTGGRSDDPAVPVGWTRGDTDRAQSCLDQVSPCMEKLRRPLGDAVDEEVHDLRSRYCRLDRDACLGRLPSPPDGACPKSIPKKACAAWCRSNHGRDSPGYRRDYDACRGDPVCRDTAERSRMRRMGACMSRTVPQAVVNKSIQGLLDRLTDDELPSSPRPGARRSRAEYTVYDRGSEQGVYSEMCRDLLETVGGRYVDLDEESFDPSHEVPAEYRNKKGGNTSVEPYPLVFFGSDFVGGYLDFLVDVDRLELRQVRAYY